MWAAYCYHLVYNPKHSAVDQGVAWNLKRKITNAHSVSEIVLLGINLTALKICKKRPACLGSSMCSALLRVQLVFANERTSPLVFWAQVLVSCAFMVSWWLCTLQGSQAESSRLPLPWERSSISEQGVLLLKFFWTVVNTSNKGERAGRTVYKIYEDYN